MPEWTRLPLWPGSLLAGARWRRSFDGALPAARVATGTLSFDGHATVGDFTGTTTEVTGEMSGASGLADVRGWVEAPVRRSRPATGSATGTSTSPWSRTSTRRSASSSTP